MLSLVNKYANELDIISATASDVFSDMYLIETDDEYFEVDHIFILEQLYEVLEDYASDEDCDNIIYKDYTIVKDFLEIYYAINN